MKTFAPQHNHQSSMPCSAGCPFYDYTHGKAGVLVMHDCTPVQLAEVWRAHATRCDQAATYHRDRAAAMTDDGDGIGPTRADHYLLAVKNTERALMLRECADEMLRRLK